MRQSFEFVGTTSAQLSLDPNEFRGLPVPKITDEIMKLLSDIAPGVSFWEQEIVEAANAISTAE